MVVSARGLWGQFNRAVEAAQSGLRQVLARRPFNAAPSRRRTVPPIIRSAKFLGSPFVFPALAFLMDSQEQQQEENDPFHELKQPG